MKIKQIEAILKASKTIAVIETLSCQWLSNGFAAYPIYNLPELTEENIFAMFDIPKDKQEKFHFYRQEIPPHLSFVDNCPTDQPLDRDIYAINDGKCQLEILITSTGIMFLPEKYLKPFSDEDFTLYERTNSEGFTYIVVKRGLEIIGIIMPYQIKDKKFIDKLEMVSKLCRVEPDDEE